MGLPTDPIKRPIAGALNNDTSNEFGGITTDDTLNSTHALTDAVMSHLTSQNSLNNISYPRRTLCVYAEVYEATPEDSYIPIWNRSTSFLGFNLSTIRVKAYDDLLHSDVGMPNITVAPDQWSDIDWAKFNMLPWFYSTDEVASVPSPGDIVVVDYTDRENNAGGIFVRSENPTSIMATVLDSGLAPAAAAFNGARAAAQGLASLVPGFGPSVTPPFTSVDDLCAGPAMTRGSAFPGGGQSVETVMIDGCPVAADVAGYYTTMRDAAASDGVTLKINSAFRGSDNAVIPEECGGGVKKGQAQLNAENCSQNPRHCDPATARDGTSRHQNGIAFDLQTGMPKDKYRPRPDAMTSIYKWLCFNAHKYGFFRSVKSERWHWEYWGTAKTQFSFVPQNHPTWDNLWTTDEGRLVLSGADPSTTPSPPVEEVA